MLATLPAGDHDSLCYGSIWLEFCMAIISQHLLVVKSAQP